MVDPNRALFEAVVRLLRPVLDDLVFVGGCTTGLFLTDPAASGIRPTKDVDAIVDVTSYAKYASLAERLRALGLAEDTTPGAPLCRWRRAEMIVDVMPTDASRARLQQSMVPRGDRNRPECDGSPATPCGSSHRRCSSPRNSKRFTAVARMTSSRVTISRTLSRSWMAARAITAEVAAADREVRAYIATEVRALLDNPDFIEALPGFLLPDAGSQARRTLPGRASSGTLRMRDG